MVAQNAGHLLHSPDLDRIARVSRLVEELGCPGRGDILPEEPEVFPHQVIPHAAQIVLQQIRQLDRLPFGQALGPFQQAPPRMLEQRLVTVGLEPLGFRARASSIALFRLLRDVEAVEHMNCLRATPCTSAITCSRRARSRQVVLANR
jgi:hypothetical protein